MQSDALELPDDLRIPLHGLQADAGYLIGRVAADSSMAGLMLQSLETRLSQVAEAAYRLNGERADLLEAAKAALVQAEGCWREHYGEDPEAVECPTPQHIGLLRDAITKAEASSCDSPSGAAGSAAAPIAAPTPQPIASSVEIARPGTGTNRSDTPEGRLADAFEAILTRRAHEKKLEGYTLETSQELALAAVANPTR